VKVGWQSSLPFQSTLRSFPSLSSFTSLQVNRSRRQLHVPSEPSDWSPTISVWEILNNGNAGRAHMTYLLPRLTSVGESSCCNGGRVIDHSQLVIDDGTCLVERCPSDDEDLLPTPPPSSLPELSRVPTYYLPENPVASSTSVKYLFVDGVLKIHEGYCKEVLGATLPLSYSEQSLAILCSTEEVEVAYHIQCRSVGYHLQLASSSIEAIDSIQDDDYCEALGLLETELATNLDDIMSLFDSLDIPLGCLSKLNALKSYHLHILVDNSTSAMQAYTPYPVSLAHETLITRRSANDSAAYLTYWEYCESLLHTFIDLLCYVPMRSLRISFTHSARIIFLDRSVTKGVKPKRFQEIFHQKITAAFVRVGKTSLDSSSSIPSSFSSSLPSSSSSSRLSESMTQSFIDSQLKEEPTLLIILSTGAGITGHGVEEVKRLTIDRLAPERCPVVFLPIGETGKNAWMRGVSDTPSLYPLPPIPPPLRSTTRPPSQQRSKNMNSRRRRWLTLRGSSSLTLVACGW
jgi:hypothetical protein